MGADEDDTYDSVEKEVAPARVKEVEGAWAGAQDKGARISLICVCLSLMKLLISKKYMSKFSIEY